MSDDSFARCYKCAYYYLGEDNVSECRRHPPMYLVSSNFHGTKIYKGFPDTRPDWWCGEFQNNLIVRSIDDKKP
jgi:hypothetical protein